MPLEPSSVWYIPPTILGGKMTNHYPPPNNPLVCKFTIVYQAGSRQWLNVFYAGRNAAWDIGAMIAAANNIKNWITSYWAAVFPSSVAATQIQVRKMSPNDPLAYDLPLNPQIAGQRSGSAEAGNVSVTMSERTGYAGRRHRGRMYVPGINVGDTQPNDIIGGALATAIASAGASFLTSLSGVSGFPIVFHRPGLTPSTFDNTFDVITSIIVDTVMDSMRRRLSGRGR